jgi:hypothetical protein
MTGDEHLGFISDLSYPVVVLVLEQRSVYKNFERYENIVAIFIYLVVHLPPP